MMESVKQEDLNNLWRQKTPGSADWPQSPRAGSKNKFFIVSADCHAQEPTDFLSSRIDKKYIDRLPGVVLGGDGAKYQKTEGFRPMKISKLQFEGEDKLRWESGNTPEERLKALEADGVDCEIIFPNKGLTIWATQDSEFSQAMCRAWNDWAWETFGSYNDKLSPMACIATGDIQGAIKEVHRSAERGFRGLCLPCKPIWGAPNHEHTNYNLDEFDPLWAAICDADMPITFHVSTGRDPRTAKGNGGAIINYAVHSLAPTMEPLVNICASGVIERFPGLRFGSIEAGIGWLPWALTAMDEAYHKHHMWVRPKLKNLPSEYFRANGFASFGEDAPGLALIEDFNLVENCLWANDFPHHEGTWPHSAAAIERTMGALTDRSRSLILGLNAAKIFKFDAPELCS